MSHLDPFHLQQLVQHFMSSQPYGPDRRIEPEMGTPPVVAEDPSRARTGPSSGLQAFQMPQRPTTQAQKKAAANAQRARDEGVKGVADALRPGAIEPDASVEPAISRGPLGPGIDDAAKEAWVNNMRRLRDAARERTKPPSGPEMSKYPGVPQYLVDQFGPPPPPMSDADETRWHGEQAVKEELSRDPRAMSSGEDAVSKALQDINMKPLIDHAMAVQEAQRRAEAIRQMIEAMRNQPPPELPESQIPENTNRPPGSEHSYVTAPDYSMLPPFPGGQGILNTPIFPPSTPPLMPPRANTNLPMSAPPRVNPDQPSFPVGIDPNIRSPGQPEKPPPVVE